MEFLFGMIGFVGFEALRVYKKLRGKGNPIPQKNVVLYIIIIIALAVFCGFLALTLAKGSKILSIYIGFTLPSSGKAVFEKPLGHADHVDDIQPNSVSLSEKVIFAIKDFFTF